MPRSIFNDEQRDKIRRLYKDGYSIDQLAKEYSVNYNTIYRICNPDKYEKHKNTIRENQQKNKKQILENVKNNYSRYTLKLHNTRDEKLVTKLASESSVNHYIKMLIKNDIENENK